MRENRYQIIITGIVNILLIILLIILNCLDYEWQPLLMNDIENILIGLLSGFMATTILTLAIYIYKLKEKLDENFILLFQIFTFITFIYGSCDEALNITDANKNYKFLQRYKQTLEQLKIGIHNSNNALAYLDVNMFSKKNNRYNIFSNSKTIIGYVDNVIQNIDKVNMILNELNQLETQIEIQKLLTFDLLLFEEKKRNLINEFNLLIVELLTNSDRVRILIYEIFKLYDKEDKKYNAINKANNVKYQKYIKKDYGLKVSKDKIKQNVLNIIDLLKLSNNNMLTSPNILLIQVKNSLNSLINEMSLVYDENNELLSILCEILCKLEDINKLNNMYQAKYYNFNWVQYFLEKGIMYDCNIILEKQPQKEAIINELNNITEIKKINNVVNEILNIINTKNLLLKIDNL